MKIKVNKLKIKFIFKMGIFGFLFTKAVYYKSFGNYKKKHKDKNIIQKLSVDINHFTKYQHTINTQWDIKQ